MKNRLNFVLMIVWIVLGAVVMTLLPGGCAAAAPAPTSTSTLLPVRVMQAAHDRVASGQYPMLVIGVVNGDKSRLYGFNAEGEPAPQADTVFEIGSVTKTFTGLALALAVESGEVALDESVAELLPNFEIPSRNGKAITLENLATQHSGLPRLPGNLQPWKNPANPYADYGVMKLEAFLSGYELKHDPGSHYKYSNLGFGLLGYALARREGVGYGELLQRAILNPLNMNSCAVRLNEAMRKHLAAGHDASENVVSNWDMAVLSGAGGLKCSAADMMGYLKANMHAAATSSSAIPPAVRAERSSSSERSRSVASPSTSALRAYAQDERGSVKTLYPAMQLAHKPRAGGPGPNKVGLGWMTLDTGDKKIVWHNGMTGGYASFIGFTANGEKGVFVITNTQQSVDDLGFATLIEGADLAPAVAQMSVAELDDYVGYYRLAPRFLLTVFRQQGQLYAEATGQGAFPIYPTAENEFFAKVGGISLTFMRDKQGALTGLVLHQHGDSKASKVDAAAAAEAIGKHLVPLDEKVLRDYVGRYRLGPKRVFDIALKDGQLYAQLTGQPAMPIYPSAKDRFFYILVNAELVFERGDQGKITTLVLHQNDVEQRAPRINSP